jgi:hypothetical protein
MCAAIGVNCGLGASTSPAQITRLGATVARIVARREYDATPLLRDLSAVGVRALMVYDRQSFEAFGPIDGPELVTTAALAFVEYGRRHGGLVAIHQPGNESDHESPSSWDLPVDAVVSLGRLARAAFPDAQIATPGLASGQPGYLLGRDLSWADAVAVHPYGKRASKDWPDPDWGTGDLDELLDGYAALGLPLIISEIGLPVPDVDEAFQADYCRRMLGSLNARPDVLVACWFALDDAVPGYGLFRADGSARPAAGQFIAAAAESTARPLPLPGGTVTPPPEPPTPPEPVLSARDAAWRDLWQSATAPPAPVPFNPDAAFYRHWQTNRDAVGLPVGPEHADDEGVFQAFSRAGVLKWAPDSDVTAA